MTCWVTGALLLVLLTAACSDEPDFGPTEDFVVQGPAGHLGDAERFEILTYGQSMDGRPQACWGMRAEGTVGYDDLGTGACIDAGRVRELDGAAFAEISGPLPKGLVTPDAAAVRALLMDGKTVEAKPYAHPDLDAAVFGFSLADTKTVKRLQALSATGEVLGSAEVP